MSHANHRDCLEPIFDLKMVKLLILIDQSLPNLFNELKNHDRTDLKTIQNIVKPILTNWPTNCSMPLQNIVQDPKMIQPITNLNRSAKLIIKIMKHHFAKDPIEPLYQANLDLQIYDYIFNSTLYTEFQGHDAQLLAYDFAKTWIPLRHLQKLWFKRILKYWHHHKVAEVDPKAPVQLMQHCHLHDLILPYMNFNQRIALTNFEMSKAMGNLAKIFTRHQNDPH